MGNDRLKGIRIQVIVILALLIIQFELGMAANLSGPPKLSPTGYSVAELSNALNKAGVVESIHASLGILLTVGGLINLIRALRSRVRSVQIVGALAFLTILLAATTGVLFVQSGFQNDGFSHGMATNFILTFSLYFLELYFLKPAPKTQSA